MRWGREIRFGHIPRTVTIVGEIADVHQEVLGEPSQPEF